jgi:hypothetical protein
MSSLRMTSPVEVLGRSSRPRTHHRDGGVVGEHPLGVDRAARGAVAGQDRAETDTRPEEHT